MFAHYLVTQVRTGELGYLRHLLRGNVFLTGDLRDAGVFAIANLQTSERPLDVFHAGIGLVELEGRVDFRQSRSA